eukprot:jgi/Ulvmu1/2485/UM137_0011.1
MVAPQAIMDIDEYPEIGDFKCKALTSTERVLIARRDAEAKEAFPVRHNASEPSCGHPVLDAYHEPFERGTGMCLSGNTGPFLALGLSTGSIWVHRLPVSPPADARTARFAPVFKLQASASRQPRTVSTRRQVVASPITSLSWIYTPEQPGSLRHVLASTQGSSISLHHATTSKLLASFTMQSSELGANASGEEGLLSSTASPYTPVVAVGGTEGSITLLDCTGSRITERASLQVPPSHGGAVGQAHASRVFTVQWHPDDPNQLLSGGWDKFVKVWDVRMHRPALTIPGPLLCGGSAAAVCPGAHVLATASWRPQHPLQLWDLRTGGLLSNLPLAPEGSPPNAPAIDTTAAALSSPPPSGSGSVGGGPAGSPGRAEQACLHELRAYSVVWLSRGVLACGGSGVRHGLRVVKADGTPVACATSAPVHDLAAFSYAGGGVAVAACCAGAISVSPPVMTPAKA